jgi:hypothetical protein
MTVESIAKRLVELCREGKFAQAQDELYAKDTESIEPSGQPDGALGTVKGLDAIKEKGKQFQERTEAMHSLTVSDAIVAGNWFTCSMTMDITMKEYGRMTMAEICLYHVRNGKVDREQFFYDMGG